MKDVVNTPHINPTGKIAKTVLMPGDPLRAEYIANTYLENVEKFNNVRGMLGFTGTYKGRTISVMGSGMGMPSIGIYSYELFDKYEVDNIIRIGSAGSYTADLDLFDVVIAKDAWTESTYAKIAANYDSDVIEANQELNDRAKKYAADLGIKLVEGRIHSSDVFYRANFDDFKEINSKHNCLAVEMESFALFTNARVLNKKATCILTISDSLVTHEATTAQQRQEAFDEMMKIALEFAE